MKVKDFIKDIRQTIDENPIIIVNTIWAAPLAFFINGYLYKDDQLEKAQAQLEALKPIQQESQDQSTKEKECKEQSADYVFKDGKCYVLLKNRQNNR